MNIRLYILSILLLCSICCCKQHNLDIQKPIAIKINPLNISLIKLNDTIVNQSFVQLQINKVALILNFSEAIDRKSVVDACKIINIQNSKSLNINFQFSHHDSTLTFHLIDSLTYLTRYKLQIGTELKSISSEKLSSVYELEFRTGINDTDKFPRISDEALLDKVQSETFKYFWDYGHLTSGLARDKTNVTDLEDCSIGGTGFGIMTIPIAISRGFINRRDGLNRINKIVDFLTNKADKFHGAFPHRINGSTGKVIEWSPGDDGADLVETSFLMMGLLTARQYFNLDNPEEKLLSDRIYSLYSNVDWNWFNKDQNGLYWLWSPSREWKHSFLIRGWNETMIVYILAAGSPTHSITKEVYEKGFANQGVLKNGNNYFGLNLPLGEAFGGPLFLSQYSFLGLNPNGLKDQYADHQLQTKSHSLINQAYCMANPKGYLGYSDACWGLTACSTNSGYKVCSPSNDLGVIAPTAALSSFAFTPKESMKALHFFYYKLGDLLWDKNGFADAFNLNVDPVWVGHQQLVYNQLPIMIAIENYRTGLIWNLFNNIPEIKIGLKKLGFTAPYLP